MNRFCKTLSRVFLTTVFLGFSCVLAMGSGLPDAKEKARECGVSSDIIQRIESAMTRGELAEVDGVSLVTALAEACFAGFPLEPFEGKLAEGLAKRVAASLILHALDMKSREYAFGRDLLLDKVKEVDPDVLKIVGEGLSKGVPREVFQSYVFAHADQQPEPFRTGLVMASLLSQSGFDYGLTSSILETGFAANTLSPHWRYLVRVVLVARQRGVSDRITAEAAREVLSAGGSLGDVSVRLGFTHRDLRG